VIKSNLNIMDGFWGSMFQDINTANGILEYIGSASISATDKTQITATAKFFRGFCYYYLVTSFGAVPLHTTFQTSASTADAPAPLADVYAQIIKDLTEAAADLSNSVPTSQGKPVTKPVALFLLAKTYLWKGWSSVGTPADFTQAYTIAKSVIDDKATYNLDLLPYFPDVFREGQEYSKEILMVIDHTRDQKFGENNAPGTGAGGPGANHSNFMWRPNYPTLNANYPSTGGASVTVRDIRNGRPFQRIRPNTKYIIDVAFANRATDSRYDGTFQTVWLSNSTQMAAAGTTGASTPRGTLINAVDTAIWMRDRVVTTAERNAFKGIMFEPEHLPGATVPFTPSFFPSVRKFDDSTRVDLNDYSDRPYILFRFAELYLIAAEAAIKGGATPADAAAMINVLRTRAARKANQTQAEYDAAVIAQQVTAAQMDIDFLLDERSRELFAEDTRWWDLSRTKKLVDRVKLYNSEGATGVQDYNRLRPIPQSQIDRVTEGPKYPQNPGYE
ncbi:MAG TPA: RagB/SusD family nutrient uptake outer membrane protein, partial [Chitinophagaceae bacterium]|nr:RagB/SusD family nutrient uptake outer membrane protein [Chitinophagaceae bacterium]